MLLGIQGPQAEASGSSTGFPTDYSGSPAKMAAAHPRAFDHPCRSPDLRYLLIERTRARTPSGASRNRLTPAPAFSSPAAAPAARIAHELASLYMVHVSTHDAAEMIREFRDEGWDVVSDTLTAFHWSR